MPEKYSGSEKDFIADDWVEPEIYPGTWRMRDGRRIKLEEMTDSHLSSSIFFIQRHEADFQVSKTYRMLVREQRRRRQAKIFGSAPDPKPEPARRGRKFRLED